MSHTGGEGGGGGNEGGEGGGGGSEGGEGGEGSGGGLGGGGGGTWSQSSWVDCPLLLQTDTVPARERWMQDVWSGAGAWGKCLAASRVRATNNLLCRADLAIGALGTLVAILVAACPPNGVHHHERSHVCDVDSRYAASPAWIKTRIGDPRRGRRPRVYSVWVRRVAAGGTRKQREGWLRSLQERVGRSGETDQPSQLEPCARPK